MCSLLFLFEVHLILHISIIFPCNLFFTLFFLFYGFYLFFVYSSFIFTFLSFSFHFSIHLYSLQAFSFSIFTGSELLRLLVYNTRLFFYIHSCFPIFFIQFQSIIHSPFRLVTFLILLSVPSIFHPVSLSLCFSFPFPTLHLPS